ncbi:hypothetical protein ACFFLG_14840 [Shewanella indica]|uniref:hypothetical protein n=1 Tax=Shewanella indica TaxID=768528 RepID=UPI000C34C6C3|nr:hypothetical protein [Shewanella indica]GHB11961.1 hypothetical protein GCM10007107_26060 [Shewanella indica]
MKSEKKTNAIDSKESLRGENTNAEKLQDMELEIKVIAEKERVISNKFKSFRGKIPSNDRRLMAYRFNSIASKYGLTASKVDFSKDYGSEQAFNVDFSRCRLNSIDNKKKRITGDTSIWLRFINYLQKKMSSDRRYVSLDRLLSDLIKDTSFLGGKEKLGLTEMIEEQVYNMADIVDEKYSLIPFYKEAARLQVEYFVENGTLLEVDINFAGVDLFSLTSSQLFCLVEKLDPDLLNKPLSSLSKEEWNKIVVDDLGLDILRNLYSELLKYGYIQGCEFEDVAEDVDEILPEEFDLDRLSRSSLRALLDYFETQLKISGISELKFKSFQKGDWELLSGCILEVFVFKRISYYLDRFEFRCSKYFELTEEDSSIVKKIVNYGCGEDVFLKQFPHILIGICEYDILDHPNSYVPTYKYAQESAKLLSEARKLVSQRKDIPNNFYGLLYFVLMPDLNNGRMLPCFFSDIDGFSLLTLNDFIYSSVDDYDGTEIPEYRFFTDIGSSAFPSVRLFKDVFHENFKMIMEEMMLTAEYALKKNPYVNRDESFKEDIKDMKRYFYSYSKPIF